MKINVFTDYRFCACPVPTGVAKHIDFMVAGLVGNPGFEVECLATKDQVGIRGQGLIGDLPCVRIPLSWCCARELWTWTGLPVADKWVDDADWIYCPKNDWIPSHRKSVKYAVTIHGASELDSNYHSGCQSRTVRSAYGVLRSRQSYKRICDRADVILTVSEWLKEFIMSRFHVAAERIVVVGNGVDQRFYDVYSDESQKEVEPYILCVGGLNHIDGGDRVVSLAENIRQSELKLRVKVVGVEHDQVLRSQAQKSGVVDFLGYVDHTALPRIMREALLLYYPTRYETFGMASAEAMATGCPVVTSRCTAVPEIVGDCGCYVDVDNPVKVLEIVEAFLVDSSMRSDCSSKSHERSLLFSWDHCVDKLKSVF